MAKKEEDFSCIDSHSSSFSVFLGFFYSQFCVCFIEIAWKFLFCFLFLLDVMRFATPLQAAIVKKKILFVILCELEMDG